MFSTARSHARPSSTTQGDIDGPGSSPGTAANAHAHRPPASPAACQQPRAPVAPERDRPRAGHRREVDRPLARGGRRRGRLRHPRRRDPPPLRPADGLHARAPHPGPPRAGRRPRGRRLRRGDRPRRRLHGDLRPGRDEPRDPHRRRPHGLGAAGRDHRAGRRVADRHRRVPGGRHRRHHAAGDQAQLPGHRPGRHPARDRRGVPHRVDRSPRPGARRHREVRDAGAAPRSRGRRS